MGGESHPNTHPISFPQKLQLVELLPIMTENFLNSLLMIVSEILATHNLSNTLEQYVSRNVKITGPFEVHCLFETIQLTKNKLLPFYLNTCTCSCNSDCHYKSHAISTVQEFRLPLQVTCYINHTEIQIARICVQYCCANQSMWR